MKHHSQRGALGVVTLSVLALVAGAVLTLSVRREITGREHGVSPSLPNGQETVLLLVGASWCPACQNDSLARSIASLQSHFTAIAKENGTAFGSIGAALDWSLPKGIEWLTGTGKFDEVMVGRSWVNSAAVRYVWQDASAEPVVPQLLILRRDVVADSQRITVGPEVVRLRRSGVREIAELAQSLTGNDLDAVARDPR